MSLIPFPTRELFEQQLPSFDLIILQNFEYLPYGIGDYLENIRSYVEGGGGLAMLGGARVVHVGRLLRHAGRGGAARRALRPVRLGADPRHAASSRRSSPTPGQMHPVTSLRYSADDNARRVEGAAAARGREPRRRREARRDRARRAPAAQDEGRQADAGDRRRRVRQGPLARGHDRHAVAVGLRRGGAPRRRRPPVHEVLGERDPLADPGSRPAQPPRRQRRRRVRARRAGARRPCACSAATTSRSPAAQVSLVVKRGADPATRRAGPDDEAHGRRRRHRGLRARRRCTPGVYRVRGPARRSRGRQVDASDIFLVREGGTELDRPVGDKATLEAIASATGGARARRRSTSSRRAWRSIRRASSASTAAPTSSCGAARACSSRRRPARARVALAPAQRLLCR